MDSLGLTTNHPTYDHTKHNADAVQNKKSRT